jgi:uncharacterized repeat protein (TIGR01451 family)
LVLTKRTLTPVVSYGDNAIFELTVTNNNGTTLANVIVNDPLPLGLIYQPGSSTVGGTPVEPTATTANGRQTLEWNAGNLGIGESRVIRFSTAVTTGFVSSDNIATAKGSPPSGPVVSSPPAKAPVKLMPGPLGGNSTIVGRVYYDNNDNNSYEDGVDAPLPGARVYLSDGRWAVTDAKGRYSIPEVAPGLYAIRLDPLTAPCIPKPVPDDQGQPGTRYIRATGLGGGGSSNGAGGTGFGGSAVGGGGLISEDFPLYAQGGLATKARSTTVSRGATSYTKTVTQAGAGYAINGVLTVSAPSENFVITDPLPSGATRGEVKLVGPNGQMIPVTVSPDGKTITIQGVLEPGKYLLSYAIFTPLPPEQVVTDPDITWEEVVR